MSTPNEPTPAPAPPIIATLAEAVQGLTYPSETDAPLTPFFWPDTSDTAPSPDTVAAHTNGAASDIKEQSVAAFFKPVVKEEEWHDEEEKAEVRRFQALQETVKSTLQSVHVFRCGDVEMDVYLVGRTAGGYAGLQTQVVET